MDVEPPDNLCERCGYPMPRLVFDEVHQLLLCGRCVKRMRAHEDEGLLHKPESV